MSKKVIACVAVFAALLAGTAWAAWPSPKAGGCCYPGSECCFPGSPCCDDDCCFPGSPCCYPGSPCCGDDCCFEGSPCCVEGAACCLTAFASAVAPKASPGKAGCCTKAHARKAEGCCGKGKVKAGHCGGCEKCFVKADKAEAAPAGVTVIAVEDMTCPSCAKKVVARLNEVAGVAKVVADTKASKLSVTPGGKARPSARAMWAAVEKAGFKPTRLEGPGGTFTALPKE